MAGGQLRDERPGTLQATALVHEAYMRLLPSDGEPMSFENRAHFFGAAGEAMRRILVDRARRRKTVKHGGDRTRVSLESIEPATDDPDEVGSVDLITLDAALGRLETRDRAMADVVKLRFFVGLTVQETATALGVSDRTVNRSWLAARTWLAREVSSSRGSTGSSS